MVAHFLTNMFGHDQTCIIGFHDHVEQNQGDIRVLSDELFRFPAGIGAEKGQVLTLKGKIDQGQLGDVVNLFLIVDKHDLPTIIIQRDRSSSFGSKR